MKNALLTTLCFLIWQAVTAQMPTIQQILKEQKEVKNRVQMRDADVYVVDSVYCYQRNQATGEDVPVSRVYNLEFTELGVVFESLQQLNDVDNQVWVNDRYTTNTFDSNDELIETVNEIWDGDAWMNDNRTLNGLNGDGDIVSVMNQHWENGAWVNDNRSTFTYNASNDNDKLIYEIWEDNAWSPDFQIFYAYNTDHLLVASIFQKWDAGMNAYGNINRIFRSYFAGTDLISEETAEVWNVGAADPDWIPSSRLTFEYDGDGNQLSRLREAYNVTNEVYSNAELVEDGYDSESNNVSTITKVWQSEMWVNQSKIDREFDEVGNLKIFRFSFWQNDAWTEASYCEFFCTLTFVDNVTETEQTLDCKMPNPFINGQFISCKNLPQNEILDLKIYDLNGKLVVSQLFDNQVNTTQFSKGIYFFTIQNKGNIVFKEKVIVE